MSKNVKEQTTTLEQRIIQLPVGGVTSGRVVIPIPFPVDHYALINSSPVKVFIVEGEEYQKPGVYTPVQPWNFISAPFTRDLQKVTIFWETDTLIQTGENLIQCMFANEEIRLQVGNIAPETVATAVEVSNFPTSQPVDVEFPAVQNVEVVNFPAVQIITNKMPIVIEVRAISVPAGAFLTIGDFLVSDGIKKVGSACSSPDSFMMNLHVTSKSSDGLLTYGSISATSSVTNAKAITGVELSSGRCRVSFQNQDSIAHIINADAVGWYN